MTDPALPQRSIDQLLERAESLAAAWGARARASTTVGQERAILRLLGVTGLDRSGHPLAGAAVDRWLSTSRDGLGGGIALPFAMALMEYDLEPQGLALDVASGAVDLALESQLLRDPARRASAGSEATRLMVAATDRDLDPEEVEPGGRERGHLLEGIVQVPLVKGRAEPRPTCLTE